MNTHVLIRPAARARPRRGFLRSLFAYESVPYILAIFGISLMLELAILLSSPSSLGRGSELETSGSVANAEVPSLPEIMDPPADAHLPYEEPRPRARQQAVKAAPPRLTVHAISSEPEGVSAGLFRQVLAALEAGDLPEAERGLDELRRLLPAQSITLLKLEAWYRAALGEWEEASELYRAVLARRSDDEEATINLALLLAAAGRGAEAERLLSALTGERAGRARLHMQGLVANSLEHPVTRP